LATFGQRKRRLRQFKEDTPKLVDFHKKRNVEEGVWKGVKGWQDC